MRKTEIIDDDGNVLTPPAEGTDAAHIIYLLEYGRTRGFKIGPVVKIGEATVQVRDLRQERQEAAQHGDEAPPDVEPGSDMAVLLG